MVLKMYMGQRKLNETFEGGIGSFLLQVGCRSHVCGGK